MPTALPSTLNCLAKVDGARGHSANRFTFRSALVNATVIFAGGFAVVQTFDAKGRSHAAGNRSGQWILPRTGIGNCLL